MDTVRVALAPLLCEVLKKKIRFTPKQRVFDSDGNFRNHHFQYNTLLRWKNNFGQFIFDSDFDLYSLLLYLIAFKEKILL
jgi:hypothetical protein